MSIEEEIIYKLIERNASSRADFVKVVGEVYSAHQIKGYHRNVDLRDTYENMISQGLIREKL